MEKRRFDFIKNMMLRSVIAMVAILVAAFSFTACTEDEVTGEDHAYVEGVTLPAETVREVSAEGGRISVALV